MATQYFGKNRGETEFQVVSGVGNANVSKDVELSIDLTKNLTKNEVLFAIEEIANIILKGNWPPA